jgi:hypothetical protein
MSKLTLSFFEMYRWQEPSDVFALANYRISAPLGKCGESVQLQQENSTPLFQIGKGGLLPLTGA